MKEQLDKVDEFHGAFGISGQDYSLRYKLMAEENDEYLEACEKGDKEGIIDALGDQLYILCGTILVHGLEDIIEEAFRRIHESNMSKLDKDGKPIINDGNIDPTRPIGKVLKSDRFKEPNFTDLIT